MLLKKTIFTVWMLIMLLLPLSVSADEGTDPHPGETESEAFKDDSEIYKLDALCVQNAEGDFVTLAWNGTFKAYEISYSGMTFNTTQTEFTVSDLTPGTEYCFTVTGMTDGEPYDSVSITYKTCTTVPELKAVPNDKSPYITVTWSQVFGADGYELYRDGSLIKDFPPGTSAYTDSKTDFGCNYEYRILAYVLNDGVRTYHKTGTQNTCSCRSCPLEPVLLKCTGIKVSEATVNWEPVKGADGYNVYVRGNGKGWSKAGNTQEITSFRVSGLKPDTEYEFCVRAYISEGTKNFFSTYDQIANAKTNVLPEPELNECSSITLNSVTVSWKAVTEAEGYYVYYRTAGQGWDLCGDITGKTSYKVTGLSCGTSYEFCVRSYIHYGQSFYRSTYNHRVSAKTIPEEPVLKKPANKSYNSVTVNWTPSSGADGYRVYYRTESGSWKRAAQIDDGTKGTYIVSGLTCGTKYYFCVRAFAKNGSAVCLSTYNKTVSFTPVPSAPSVSTTSESSAVKISWKAVSGATSYRVYRKTETTEWKLLASVSSSTLSYTDKTVSGLSKYRYTVKALHDSVHGYYVSGIEGCAKVKAVSMKSIIIGTTSSTITWSSVSGADGYRVYRKESNGSSFVKVADVTSTSFTDTGLSANLKYSYKVSGYMILNGTKTTGSLSCELSPTLSYSGTYVQDVKKTYLGLSGAGRAMYSYQIGTGSNHIVVTAAVHGYEDSFKKDGECLVETAENLIKYAAKNTSVLKNRNFSVYVLPCANPDGLIDGTTNNGPGRCTTYRFDSNGKLVKGGLDINRSFPYGFSAYYSARNYTGSKPLMSRESVVIKSFIDNCKGSGKNIFIDAHGWENSILSDRAGSGITYTAFHRYFPGCKAKAHGGLGYVSGYAHGTQGYVAVLFEFPKVSSKTGFSNAGYSTKFINSVWYMVNNY